MELNKSSHIYRVFQSIMVRKIALTVWIAGGMTSLYAQGYSSQDYMRSIGKIYVVAAVCLIILCTLLIYMVLVDRRITKIEKRQKNE